MKKVIVLFGVISITLLSGQVLANSGPVVSNITASQHADDSKLVDIHYDLADADGDNCTVWVVVSDDGGISWQVPAFTCLGWANDLREPNIAVIQLKAGSTLADANALVDQAGQDGADLVLLPMEFAVLNPQTTTGIVFQTLSVLAVEHDMYVVAPIPESSNGYLYKTAIIIDPNGELAGIYRQTHVSPEDRLRGVSAGDELPVFETRFGKIGILLGYDLLFREAARIMALRGAELLLYSYEGNSNDETLPAVRLGEAVFFDGYYVAMAGLVEPGGEWASNILGLDGRPMVVVGDEPCVVSASCNLQNIKPRCSGFSREKLFACRDPYAVDELTDETTHVIDQNSQTLTIACVQCVDPNWEHIKTVLNRAGQLGADVVLTQEAYLPNPDHLPIEEVNDSNVISTLCSIAADHNMTIIGGISLGVKGHANVFRSSYIIVGPDGNIAGVHYQHTGRPADDFDLFDTGFGSFGGLVCWDLIVMGPEYARVEALKGARILFYGTLTISEDANDLVFPSLAKQNVIPIAFSAHSNNDPNFPPQAGIVAADGTYLEGTFYEVEPGGGEELVLTEIELALPLELQTLKQQLWNDRRPELYTPLTQSDICLTQSEVTLVPEEPVAGRLAVVTAITYNALVPETADYNVGFFVDSNSQGTHRVLYERWSSLPTGSWDFDYRFLCSACEWIATPGTHEIIIEADPNGDITELRKDNNLIKLHVEVPEPVPPPPPPEPNFTPAEYPELSDPWQYLGYFYDPLYDGGVRQTNCYLDRTEIYSESPWRELLHAGHHVGTHLAVQYRESDGSWYWRPAFYPDRESVPEYPPLVDPFSAVTFIEDPQYPGAYMSTYQMSTVLGAHSLFYISPRQVASPNEQPYDAYPLLSMRSVECACGDPICRRGIWCPPVFFTRGGTSCMLALPNGYRPQDDLNVCYTMYPVVFEHDANETWTDVQANDYQFIWVRVIGEDVGWKPLRWNALEMLPDNPVHGYTSAVQGQAAVFSYDDSLYLLMAGGATHKPEDWANPTSRGFIFLYRFLDDPAPGPQMDYRVECVQVVVDPQDPNSGSPAMVGGYIGGGLELMRINDTTSSVPTYLCGVHRLEATDPNRWKEDFGSGPENVSGGFVLLQGRVEQGQPQFDLVPPEPEGIDYLDSYGMVVVPKPGNDDIIFKVRFDEDHFEVLHVPGTNGTYNIGRAEVLLDSNEIEPSQTWKPYFYSACFLGLVLNEHVSGGLDLIVPLSLEDVNDPNHQRHGYISWPNISLETRVKWSQPPLEIDPNLDPNSGQPVFCGWNEASLFPYRDPCDPCSPKSWEVVADDFRCLGTMPVTSVRWWGSYVGWNSDHTPELQPIGYRMGFWSNVPAGVAAPYSYPQELLWDIEVPAERVVQELAGWDLFPTMDGETCFRYYVELEPNECFWQDEFDANTTDNIYWLSIAAIYPNDVNADDIDYPWGWKTRPQHWMDDAVTIGLPTDPCVGIVLGPQLVQPIEDDSFGAIESYDVAFELDTDPNWIKWEQSFAGLRNWGYHTGVPSYGVEFEGSLEISQIAADDWLCRRRIPVSSIVWWGSYLGNEYTICQGCPAEQPESPDYFLISIWTDIPDNDPCNLYGYSHPDSKVWEYKAFDYDEVLVGYCRPQMLEDEWFEPVFRYSMRLSEDDWFCQPNVHSIYWLSIAAVYTNGYPEKPWAWTNHEHVFSDDGVRGWPDLGDPNIWYWEELFDETTEESRDLSFLLFTDPDECCQCANYNLDEIVNFIDYGNLAGGWRWSGQAGGYNNADLNCDGEVDFYDLCIFVNQWLNSCP